MPIAPKNFDDLRHRGITGRTAHAVAAVLPNLPTDESLIVLRSNQFGGYESDPDRIDHLTTYHIPVVPGSDVYRVTVGDGDEDADTGNGTYTTVEPVPHPRRKYRLSSYDFKTIVSLDPDEYDFDDTDQTTFTDFGSTSPYFAPSFKLSGEYDRKPHLPV